MRKLSLLLSALLPLMSGCVETIEMDPGEEDLPVVVNCFIAFSDGQNPTQGDTDVTIELTLQYARGKSQAEFLPVEEAEVYIEDFAGRRIQFDHKEGCRWESTGMKDDRLPWTLETEIWPDQKYTLRVEIPGREAIWAETCTPPKIRLEFTSKPVLLREEDDPKVEAFRLEGDGLDRCALWATGWEYRSGQGSTRNRTGMLPLDYIVTDHPYADDFNVCGKSYADLTFLGTTNWSRALDAYYEACFRWGQEKMAGYPLHEGFVRIYNLAYDESFTILPGPLYCVDSGYFLLLPEVAPYAAACSLIEWRFVTEDMDRYLRSVYVRNLSLDRSLSYVYSTSNDVYSNIHGGLGIFGSYYIKNSYFIAADFNIYPRDDF